MKLKLILFVIFFSVSITRAQGPDAGKKMESKEIKLLIDSISLALKHWYIYPDKAALIEKTLKANFKNGAYKNTKDRVQLANMLHEDIQKTHHDGHMRVMYAPGFAEDLMTVLPDSMVKKEMQQDLEEERSHNFFFIKTEVLHGDIGYVRWDGFVGFTKEAKPTYESAFQFVANTKALIIDMRYNGGGSPETVNAMLNYFFDKKLPMNHIIDHKHDTVKNYTDPAITPFKLSMPVYVLTSKRTFSGAEDFTYAMKVAKRATIVGDTTGGGAHPTGPAPLGQGFVLNIPNARSYHELTKTNWEGAGVYPDVHVQGELALEKSLQLIFKSLLEKANNEWEKKNPQWQLNVLDNKLKLAEVTNNETFKMSKEKLQIFCGEYVAKQVPGSSPFPLSLLLKGDNLYRHIPIPPDWKLVPISNNRFLYDNDVESNRYMEFTFDKDGKVTGLTVYRADGAFPYDKVK